MKFNSNLFILYVLKMKVEIEECKRTKAQNRERKREKKNDK